jgi:hypothetical protein
VSLLLVQIHRHSSASHHLPALANSALDARLLPLKNHMDCMFAQRKLHQNPRSAGRPGPQHVGMHKRRREIRGLLLHSKPLRAGTARAPGNTLQLCWLFCILALLSSGCVPWKFTTSPGATGRVVDARTHTPISGAELVISRSTYPPPSVEKAFVNHRAPMVMTGETGGFSVPLQRRIDLYCVPVDIFPRFGLLVVRCQGYKSACVPFWSRSVADLGEIQLETAAPIISR